MVGLSPHFGLLLGEGALMVETVVIAVLSLLGTAWGAWLTYRGVKTKGHQDSQAVNFSAMQSEISRLRDDLNERDLQARQNHEEILVLRTEIRAVGVSLTEWITGAHVLYHQLVAADIVPLFVPSTLGGPK